MCSVFDQNAQFPYYNSYYDIYFKSQRTELCDLFSILEE